jgi:hypothetical protein
MIIVELLSIKDISEQLYEEVCRVTTSRILSMEASVSVEPGCSNCLVN